MATHDEIMETPFATVHPTEIIKDELKARGLSQRELAARMEMQPSNLSRFLKGENITPAIAAKLEMALDIPAEIWLNMQAQYEKDLKAITLRDEQERAAINAEKMLSNILNLPELFKRLSISSSLYVQSRLAALENLLGFPALEVSKQPFALQVCYKKSEKFEVEERNQMTWLTLAFIASKNKPNYPFVDGNALKAALEIAKGIHKGHFEESDIRRILNENGIAYNVVRKLEKTPIDAVAMQMDGYPAIITTHRYDDMSRLVFNVLHELGHIHLHMCKELIPVFISSDESYSINNKEEKEANRFAEDMLIDREVWKKMMSTKVSSLSSVIIIRKLRELSEMNGLDFNIVAWRYRYESHNYNLSIKPVHIV